MIFHTNHKQVINPDIKIIKTIHFNFLGLLISANAKWACHVISLKRFSELSV